jgi:hypothetical protein
VFKTAINDYQYAEVLVNGKTGSRHDEYTAAMLIITSIHGILVVRLGSIL